MICKHFHWNLIMLCLHLILLNIYQIEEFGTCWRKLNPCGIPVWGRNNRRLIFIGCGNLYIKIGNLENKKLYKSLYSLHLILLNIYQIDFQIIAFHKMYPILMDILEGLVYLLLSDVTKKEKMEMTISATLICFTFNGLGIRRNRISECANKINTRKCC
jgi:hypothetical protein